MHSFNDYDSVDLSIKTVKESTQNAELFPLQQMLKMITILVNTLLISVGY